MKQYIEVTCSLIESKLKLSAVEKQRWWLLLRFLSVELGCRMTLLQLAIVTSAGKNYVIFNTK